MVQESSIKIYNVVLHRIELTSLDPCIVMLEYLAENMNFDKSIVDD